MPDRLYADRSVPEREDEVKECFLDFYKKICYNIKKTYFFLVFPIGLTYVKKYVIIIMEENNNKPIGPKQKFYMNAGRSESDRLYLVKRTI